MSHFVSALTVGLLLTQPLQSVEAPQGASTSSSQPAARGQAETGPTPAWLNDCGATILRTEAEQVTLPSKTEELLRLIAVCGGTTQRLIAEGQFGSVYLSAMMGKDVALALETHVSELPPNRRSDASSAIRSFVVAAWLLDAYGDLGNREKLSHAFNLFSRGIEDITAAYGGRQDTH